MARDDWDDGEDWEDEDWDDGDLDGTVEPEGRLPADLGRGLAFGFLAMLPLVLAYELALDATGGRLRSAAEVLLSTPLAPLGASADAARRLLLLALALFALAVSLRRHWALGPALVRVVVEGAVGALALGPVIALVLHALVGADAVLPQGGTAGGAPGGAEVAFVVGAAAYEELVFRVGAFCALWVVVRRAATWLGGGPRGAAVLAELVALVGSGLLFAAFHLEAALGWLGHGGEPFDAGVFTYRTVAGILLALVFRWRGPGVAAWTHGLFNLALLLGAGPRIYL